MELLKSFIQYILHLNEHLNDLVVLYGLWTYLILFAIVFCETGLVVLPFLPGDSLLFAVGALAATEGSALNPHLCFVLLSAAAILGDTLNYYIGYLIGPKAYESGRMRFIKKEHLDRTHAFYEKYGGKTIILARFVPIVRTFAPFVAGIGKMSYGRFIAYNVIGGLAWPFLLIYTGYLFGNFDPVKNNFPLVILAIIIISVLPIVYEMLVAWRKKRLERAQAGQPGP